jgi:hypothetical protein
MSKPFETTPERRANLVKLARFLYTEPIEAKQFRMSFYNSDSDYAASISQGCDTAGCAIGWAVTAGIEPLPKEDYYDFCCRTLIDGGDGNSFSCHEWSWCFDCGWGLFGTRDNTPKGAAKRILWLLLYGLPVDWKDQANGKVPICYADWEPSPEDWSAAEGLVSA